MRRTPQKIKDLVEEHAKATSSRRDRMDADYEGMWLLNELPENAGNPTDTSTGPIIGDGFRHYISNAAKSFAKKVVSIAAEAKIIIRVRSGKTEPRPKRDLMNDKERFLIGVYAAGDERLRDLLQPSLQDQLSWYGPIRGWVAVRALLRKRKDKSTFVDIQPLDPRNTYWSIGPDGVEWVCVKTMRTARDIKSIYHKTVPGNEGGEEESGVAVYDFVDAEHHQVVTEDTVLEGATRHGSPRVPVWIGPVGENPQVSSNGSGGGSSADYGESIFATNRGLYPLHNFMMSVVLELMGRARSPGDKVFSADGSKTLDADPHKEGSRVSLRKDSEDIVPLEQIETTKDAILFSAAVDGEKQRGSLPNSVFGELPFQLSGFAINSLRQGVATIVNPTIKAMSAAYLGIGNLLVDQYVTGQFKAMEVSGFERDPKREYFSREITPDQVKEAGGHIVVEVLPSLPQDEPAKWQMAGLARQENTSGIPLFADRTIGEDILNRQDPDADATAVFEQLARRSTPLAQALEMMKAAAEMEDSQLEGIWLGEAMRIFRDILFQTQQQGGQNGGGEASGEPGLSPSTAPTQALGAPQPAPTPQAGPLVAQGQPRPGARNDGVTLDEMLLG